MRQAGEAGVVGPDTVRAWFAVVLERTVRELRGLSCLDLKDMAPAEQQIVCSRCFGRNVSNLTELRKVVACHAVQAAEELRVQSSVAGAIQVFICRNPFKPREPQYQRAMSVPLPEPMGDRRELTAWGLYALESIYREGYAYQEAGVMLSEIQSMGLSKAHCSRNLAAKMDEISADKERKYTHRGRSRTVRKKETTPETETARHSDQAASSPTPAVANSATGQSVTVTAAEFESDAAPSQDASLLDAKVIDFRAAAQRRAACG